MGFNRAVVSATSREFHPCTVLVQPPNAVTRSGWEYHYLAQGYRVWPTIGHIKGKFNRSAREARRHGALPFPLVGYLCVAAGQVYVVKSSDIKLSKSFWGESVFCTSHYPVHFLAFFGRPFSQKIFQLTFEIFKPPINGGPHSSFIYTFCAGYCCFAHA